MICLSRFAPMAITAHPKCKSIPKYVACGTRGSRMKERNNSPGCKSAFSSHNIWDSTPQLAPFAMIAFKRLEISKLRPVIMMTRFVHQFHLNMWRRPTRLGGTK